MKSKRADMGPLPTETVKILIAVLAIGVLAILAYQLYSIFTTQSDYEKAKASLNNIVETIDYIQKNNLLKGEVVVLNPKEWTIVPYSAGNGPSSCLGKDCLCICSGVMIESQFSGYADRLKNSCETQGICKETVSLKVVQSNNFGFNLGIDFKLNNVPMEFTIVKEDIWKIYPSDTYFVKQKLESFLNYIPKDKNMDIYNLIQKYVLGLQGDESLNLLEQGFNEFFGAEAKQVSLEIKTSGGLRIKKINNGKSSEKAELSQQIIDVKFENDKQYEIILNYYS